MIGSSRRTRLIRTTVIAAVAAVAPLASACEAGNNAPTLHWHPPTDGTTKVFGTITISNAFIVGAPLTQSLPAGGSAGLFLALTNIGSQDTLIGISAPGTAPAVRLRGGAVQLPTLSRELLTGPRPAVVLQNLTRALPGGSAVELVLTFRIAGSTPPIWVPVMPRNQYYATYSPPAASPSSPSPSAPGATGSASPAPGKSARPSASPSP